MTSSPQSPQPRPLRAGFFVPTFNAGETTRGIEVARALRDSAAELGRPVEIVFFGAARLTNTFVGRIEAAGFPVTYLESHLTDEMVAELMRADHEATEFITDVTQGREAIERTLALIRDHRIDLILHGFFPPAGIAAQILGMPAVCFLPFPPSRSWARRHLVKDIPDPLENGLTIRMPVTLRRLLVKFAGTQLPRQSFFTQPTLATAARELGWRCEAPDLFSMLAADLQLINDLPDFYAGQDVGPRCQVTGPLFSRAPNEPVPPEVIAAFAPGRERVFVMMGSSGEKQYVLEALKAVVGGGFNAVVVVLPSVCPLAEISSSLEIPSRVFLTDRFLPAEAICHMADVAVIHGGQGTVQTALHAGTPLVGVAMQAEQQANLDNVAQLGAGIRVPRKYWEAGRIRAAIRTVLDTPSFKEAALRLQVSCRAIDGRKEAGSAIWKLIDEKLESGQLEHHVAGCEAPAGS